MNKDACMLLWCDTQLNSLCNNDFAIFSPIYLSCFISSFNHYDAFLWLNYQEIHPRMMLSSSCPQIEKSLWKSSKRKLNWENKFHWWLIATLSKENKNLSRSVVEIPNQKDTVKSSFCLTNNRTVLENVAIQFSQISDMKWFLWLTSKNVCFEGMITSNQQTGNLSKIMHYCSAEFTS